MASTTAICNSYKVELMQAKHDHTQGSGNTFRVALYTASATLNKDTTVYGGTVGSVSDTNELATGVGGYVAGGLALSTTTLMPILVGDQAITDYDNITFTNANFSTSSMLLFNGSVDLGSGLLACQVHDFDGVKTASNADFTIEMPPELEDEAITRLA